MARIEKENQIAGLYDLKQTLGKGHFSVVKLAKHVFTGEEVAVKVIDKTKLDDISKSHLYEEVRCMQLVQHPNIVRLYHVIETQTKLYLVLELGTGGDLYDYLMERSDGLQEDEARHYFRQIVLAIAYCHRLHVVHRDLKLENVVFFDKNSVVKLTDFGFSNRFFPGEMLSTSCGSLAYSAPEILLGDSYDAPRVDIWSLGVMLYMLVAGRAPFMEANDSETLSMIMDCKYVLPPSLSPSCQTLIRNLLIRDPAKRYTLQQIWSNPWVTAGPEDSLQQQISATLAEAPQLSPEEHNMVVQKMISGRIADKETIIKELAVNSYNHITATYYLLAEKSIRKRALHGKKVHPSRSMKVKKVSESSITSVKGDHHPITRMYASIPGYAKKHKETAEDEDDSDEETNRQFRCRANSLTLNKHAKDKPTSQNDRQNQDCDDNIIKSLADYPSNATRKHSANLLQVSTTFNQSKRTCLEEDAAEQHLLMAPQLTNAGKYSVPNSLDQIAEQETEDDEATIAPKLRHSRSTGRIHASDGTTSSSTVKRVSSRPRSWQPSTSSEEDDSDCGSHTSKVQSNTYTDRNISHDTGYQAFHKSVQKHLTRQRKVGYVDKKTRLKTIESCSSADVSDESSKNESKNVCNEERGIFMKDISDGSVPSVAVAIPENEQLRHESVTESRTKQNITGGKVSSPQRNKHETLKLASLSSKRAELSLQTTETKKMNSIETGSKSKENIKLNHRSPTTPNHSIEEEKVQSHQSPSRNSNAHSVVCSLS